MSTEHLSPLLPDCRYNVARCLKHHYHDSPHPDGLGSVSRNKTLHPLNCICQPFLTGKETDTLLSYISRVLIMILSNNKRYQITFMDLLGICMSSLDKCLYLFLKLDFFPCYPVLNFSYILVINSLSVV